MKIKSYPLYPAKWFFQNYFLLVPDIQKLLTQVYISFFLRIFSSNVCTCTTYTGRDSTFVIHFKMLISRDWDILRANGYVR